MVKNLIIDPNDEAPFISYGSQTVNESDIAEVCSVLSSDLLTQGPKVTEFEQALCNKVGAKYATVVSSGTAALHLVGLALGWQKGMVVLTTPLTFLASANCILYAGATPDFVDIDPVSYTIDPNQLEAKIRLLRSQGKVIKAIVAVDYAGHPCDWEALKEISDKYELQLVDDSSHALGATYKNNPQGSCKYADVTIFSFHPVKNITTGEGGAVMSNDKALDERIKLLRSHGITKDVTQMQKNEGPWYYEMKELGFNYRITDIQCTLGINQLKRLDEFIEKRQFIATYYSKHFSEFDLLILPNVSPEISHAWHLYPLQINIKSTNFKEEDDEKLHLIKVDLFQKLKVQNIGVQVHYVPIHLQPYYKNNFSFKKGDFPLAESFYAREISIPIYPSLKLEEMEYVTKNILGILNSICGT